MEIKNMLTLFRDNDMINVSNESKNITRRKGEMDYSKIVSHIDYTLLKPCCTWKEIVNLCDQALSEHTASVCIPPSYVKRVRQRYGDALTICTVIGFPLGYNSTESKVFETQQAISDGADEVDMVVNLGDVKTGDFQNVTNEIKRIRSVSMNKILKVIIETCYLTKDEKIKLCHCVTDAQADYIKTSTGFGTAGANLDDICIFKDNIGKNVKIKAAGGIRTREKMEEFLNAGCERIGASVNLNSIEK